jgi:hypothetical protein
VIVLQSRDWPEGDQESAMMFAATTGSGVTIAEWSKPMVISAPKGTAEPVNRRFA